MGEEEFCRLCAETKPLIDLLSIKDEYWSKQDLDKKINKFFQIKILPTDKLPKCVCYKCCERVNITWEFNEKIHQAQETLRSVLSDDDDFVSSEISFDRDSVTTTKSSSENSKNGKANSPAIELVECVLYDSQNKTNKQNMAKDETIPIIESNSKEKEIRKKIIRSNKDGEKRKNRVKGRKLRKKSGNSNESDDQCSESDEDVSSIFAGLNTTDRNEDGSLNITMEGWETYPWMCVECNERLDTAIGLRNHHQTIHNQPAKYICVECPKIYTKYYGFITHVRCHRKYLKYCCDACNKFFENRKLLQVHRTTHMDARPFACTTCGKTFRMQSALYVHSRSHLPVEVKNKFACDQCPKKFGTKPNLMAHKRIHTGVRDYTCDQCGKSFIQKGNLDNHMLTHDATRPFTCETCGKSFKTVMRLKKHGSVHSGLKPHKCDVCGRQFRERGTLKEHHRIHTGAMPFTCEFCGKSFRFKGVLTTHRRQHTGERPYSCNECQHHFTNWPNYNKHMKRRHGINTSVTTRKPQTIPPTGMPNRNPPGTVIAPSGSHVYIIQDINLTNTTATTNFADPDPFGPVVPTNATTVTPSQTASVPGVNTLTAVINQDRVTVATNATNVVNTNTTNDVNLNTANLVNIQPAHLTTQNYYMLHGLYNIPGMNTEIAMQHAQQQ